MIWSMEIKQKKRGLLACLLLFPAGQELGEICKKFKSHQWYDLTKALRTLY